jgi:hypothetical protein
MMGQFRDVADEIVLAADARMDASGLGECAAVADRLVRYEYAGFERSVAWLHRQCSREWILLIGSDEVASPALIAQLPELVAAHDVVQYWIPTRWSYPDPDHWLDERPWYPGFHNRLVRNDATLSFAGLQHTEADAVFPARYLEAPLYHLDCVITSLEARRRKVAEYERLRPGLAAPGGGPFNATYYLPEEYARRPPRAVPPEDRVAIAGVLEAAPNGATPPTDLPLADQSEVDRHWPGRPVSQTAYRARIESLEHDPRTFPGEHRELVMRVTNEGTDPWGWGSRSARPIHVGARLLEADGATVVSEGERTPFPADVPPGTSCVVPVIVLAPDAPGHYVVEVDVVHEHVRWFGRPVQVDLIVGTRD